MVYTPHDPVKVQKIADLAAGLADHELVLPKLFTREGFEQFKGAEGDKLIYRVPGRLPHRRYAFRNDRSSGIIFDVYKEGKTEITWGDRIYSAVEVTDEQIEFDLDGWAKLFNAQSGAVAQGLNDEMANAVTNAPYEVTIGGTEADLRGALIEARRVLNRFRVPREARMLIVGSEFEAAMLAEDKLVLAKNVGDARADTALGSAILGSIMGFTVVQDLTIPGDTAYAVVGSAFVQVTGAPYIPNSVGMGASASVDGFSLRWLRDYDMKHVQDRSLVDTYCGANAVKDLFLPKSFFTSDPDPQSVEVANLNQYFVRGVKLTLGGASIYPSGAGKADLIAETGISAANAWEPASSGNGSGGDSGEPGDD